MSSSISPYRPSYSSSSSSSSTPASKPPIKILLMGDSNANKSLFMARYTQEDSFTYNNFVTTTGVDFKIKNTEVYGEVRKLYIWDTAGQERFSAMTAQYYRGAHAVFIL